jgi:hypothetical protein
LAKYPGKIGKPQAESDDIQMRGQLTDDLAAHTRHKKTVALKNAWHTK